MRCRALTLAALLLAAACSGDPRTDETAVLGATTERAGVEASEPGPTEPSATEPAATAGPAQPSPSPSPTIPPVATATALPTPDATEEDAEPSRARTERAAEPAPAEPEGPEVLTTGEGWSMNALLPDADGEGWTEVGGPPPADREAGSAERLLVRLRHVEAPGDSAGRQASCEGWLEASPQRGLRAHGEVLVELLVDGEAIAEQRRPVDVTVGAGDQHALQAWDRSRLVHAAEGATVACTIAFTAAG